MICFQMMGCTFWTCKWQQNSTGFDTLWCEICSNTNHNDEHKHTTTNWFIYNEPKPTKNKYRNVHRSHIRPSCRRLKYWYVHDVKNISLHWLNFTLLISNFHSLKMIDNLMHDLLDGQDFDAWPRVNKFYKRKSKSFSICWFVLKLDV